MEALSGSERVPPPWNALGLDSAESLREAQEYFFQTHATNARLIAEGRNAQGFMKMAVRRKLSKEIGEDFKMYTGQAIGEASESAESVGIRGELNVMIKTVYQKIAPTTPITSPTQEDSTILSHPLGALEVVYDMVYFYTSLLKKYATLAGNRRKTLKSVLDEELFKWIWRLTCTYLLAPAEKRSTFTQAIPSVGLAFIPAERQRVPSAEKILDIGKFLLGKTMMESHLRFSLCYYYVTFVRQLQYELLAQPPKIPPEPSYEAIKRHRPDQLVENPLVAVDVLMNFSGNSMQSFDDVLKDEANEIQKYIPPNEIEFIQQFQEFTPERLKHSLQRFLPKVSAAAMPEDPTGTLMPMLLLLRTMRFITRQLVLEHIPGPYLSLLINRSQHGGIDEVEKPLVDLLKEVTVGRQRKGEQYTLTTRIKGSVEVQPPGESATAARAPAAAPAAAPAPARPAAGGAPAARPAPAAAAADAGAWFQGRVILAWRVEKGKVEVFSISGADMAATAGADAHFMLQLVMFALQTGQVFPVSQGRVSKEQVQQLLAALIGQVARATPARLAPAARAELLAQAKGLSAHKFLMAMLKKGLVGAQRVQWAGHIGPALDRLGEKLGEQLGEFLRNPGHERYKPIVQGLTEAERQAITILQRVARAQ